MITLIYRLQLHTSKYCCSAEKQITWLFLELLLTKDTSCSVIPYSACTLLNFEDQFINHFHLRYSRICFIILF